MSTYKHIDKIICIVLAMTLLITVLFMNGEALGIQSAARVIGYENRLFDTGRVHTIDIVMEDWDSFIASCENEEYAVCSAVIDGEAYRNIGIRAKGNTSLSSVSSMNSERYSFKIEFDQYDSTKSYHGLDKLSLNNLIQDNTFMKDYLVYQMMGAFGVSAPLCSFAYITVNGEDWGLYLAVEGVEDAFLQRNYGSDYGELYKPDSMSIGGGRGNGMDFRFEDLDFGDFNIEDFIPEDFDPRTGTMPAMPDMGGMPAMPEGFDSDRGGGRSGMSMGSADVKLQYSDDDPDSYSNIFGNAKTDITEADQTRLIAALKTLSESDNPAAAVDVEAVIRYFVVHSFTVNGDSYTGTMVHNYYLYEENGLLSMIPWDYNLAFGTFQGNSASSAVNDPIDSLVSGGDISDRPMAAWIFADEEYTALYHEYYEHFLETVCESGLLTDTIDTVSAMIAPYVEKDPTKFCTYEEFAAGVTAIRAFCTLRAESIRGQLDGTIPSTSEGQSADSSALVNASSLTLSDMGTMGNTMGGGDRGNRGGITRGNMPGAAETEDSGSTAPTSFRGMNGSAGFGEMPSDEMPNGVMPSGEMPNGGMPGGEMPNGGMPSGGMPGVEMPNQEMSGDGSVNTSDSSASASESTADVPLQSDGEMPSGNRFGGGQMGGGGQLSIPGDFADGAAQTDSTAWILLAVSAAVLALGLIFAWKFK